MTCRGCDKDISHGETREVGRWRFCMECFERLTAEPAPAKPAPAKPATAKPREERQCLTCERTLVDGEFLELGGMQVCRSCYGQYLAEPLARIERELDKDAAQRVGRAQDTPLDPDEIRTAGVAGRKLCTSCGRRLIEPGGYHVIDGEPFCPACTAKLRAGQVRRPATSDTCDACDRNLAAGGQSVEGFVLCRACLGTDAQGALELARARHRVLLRELRGRVGLGD